MAEQIVDDISFYFFDIDDNILFLPTEIFVQNTETGEEVALSTGQYADVHPQLGRPGKWEDFAESEQSFRMFRDVPADQMTEGMRQPLLEDIDRAMARGGWKGPSWRMFLHACKARRPTAFITARGHGPETIRDALNHLAVANGAPAGPDVLAIFPVTHPGTRAALSAGHPQDLPPLTVPALKKRAIRACVDLALERYGAEPDHRFGMSDDDPKNVELVISAMRDCKVAHPHKRFFVINTHVREKVKLEVFPADFPVT